MRSSCLLLKTTSIFDPKLGRTPDIQNRLPPLRTEGSVDRRHPAVEGPANSTIVTQRSPPGRRRAPTTLRTRAPSTSIPGSAHRFCPFPVGPDARVTMRHHHDRAHAPFVTLSALPPRGPLTLDPSFPFVIINLPRCVLCIGVRWAMRKW